MGVCPDELSALWPAQDYALHVLVQPDIPWQPDPLRENPKDRDWLFGHYELALKQAAAPYIVVGGDRVARVAQCLQALAPLI